MKLALIVLFLFLLFNGKALGQAGYLDSTFGTNGIVAPFPDGDATDIAVQQDGKILVCGYSGSDGFTVIRLNTSGDLDTTFGTNGISKTIVGAGNDIDARIAIQSDGRIVVAGTCATSDGYWSCALMRLQENGVLDYTFGMAGKLVYSLMDPHEHSNYSYGIAIGPDQKITTAVFTSTVPDNHVFGVARFTSNGAFDNTFGSNGIVLTTIGNQYASPNSIQIQADGKTVVGGSSDSGSDGSFAIARYNIDGSLDNSFSSDGKDTLYFYNNINYSGSSSSRDFFIQPNGMIVMAGNTIVSNSTIGHVCMARYTPAGILDLSFGIGGKKSLEIPGYEVVNVFSVTGQADGKFVIAGSCAPATTNLKFTSMVVRTFQDGTLDTGFGVNGVAAFNVDSMPGSYILSAAMDDQQRIVCAGFSHNLGFMALRYLSGLYVGVVDLTNNQHPLLIYPNPVSSEAKINYTLTEDHRITISLFDVLGREVQRFFTNVSQNKGAHTMELSFSPSLAAGEYLLSIADGRNSQGVKLFLQK